MAKLIQCRHCGNTIAKSANVCPHCGGKNKKKSWIGKAFFVVILLGVIGSLLGGNEEEKEPVNKPESNEIVKTEEKKEEEKKEETPIVSAGIDPAFKEFMDTYETVMNEYCDFMVKYQNASSTDMITMLSDYNKMMSKYADYADKIDQYDTSKFNNEEMKYYLEVTNRVNQKLLSIAG